MKLEEKITIPRIITKENRNVYGLSDIIKKWNIEYFIILCL